MEKIQRIDQGATSPGPPPVERGRLPYVAALDGLRALAVGAVLLYHAGLGTVGGFLGVETFFVLSGFLITALLRAEWNAAGRIDVRAFWLRRVRRLLPALLVMLAGTFLLTALARPDELAPLRGTLVAALAYVMNWFLILGEHSYFDPTARPPLLQHLWSLAIEEQFYLVWPLVVGLALRRLRRWAFLALLLLGAVGSGALMLALFDPGADPSRVYYGTDTRASALLIGAALALVWAPWQRPATSRVRTGRTLDGIGLLALVAVLYAYASLYETHPQLYRGGFALVALASAALIAAVTHPATRLLPRLLGTPILRWIGARSYGIYLWHWPILMLTRPGVDVALTGWPLAALRIASIVLLAELSYRLVEVPVQRGALTPAARTIRRLIGRYHVSAYVHRTLRWRPLWSALTLCLVFGAACTSPIVPATPSQTAGSAAPSDALALASAAASLPAASLAPTLTATATAEPTSTPTSEPTNTPTTEPTSTPTSEPTPTPLPQIDAALAAELQRILDATVADGAIPGAVVSVRIAGYAPWSGASGVADREQQTPLTPITNMRIASISKIFTAVVVLQLVEEGRIALDAPISTYLGEVVPNAGGITVQQLLQHTSGLYDYLEDRNFVAEAYQNPGRRFAPDELVAYAAEFAPAFPAGSAGNWDYSSTNFVLLGMIVEQVTGRPLAQEMRARIFEPLSLEQTYFAPDEEVPATAAHGYSRTTDQSRVAMSFAYATANVVSVPDDVRRFIDGLLGGQLLQPTTLDQMLRFVSGKGQYNMPALEYGLGIMRNSLPVGPGPNGQARTAETSRVIGHIGGFGGFRSAVWSAPDGSLSLALGVNQGATDPNLLATEIYAALLNATGR